jgi:hypothetical protein
MPETLHKMTAEEQEAIIKRNRELFFKYENPAGLDEYETRGRPKLTRTEPATNVELRQMREAWAAGCVEVRGSLIPQNGLLKFQMHSKNTPMLNNLRTLFGGSVMRKNGGDEWTLTGREKVNDFLDKVLPWLTKARRAELQRKRESIATVETVKEEKSQRVQWSKKYELEDSHEGPLTGRFIGDDPREFE